MIDIAEVARQRLLKSAAFGAFASRRQGHHHQLANKSLRGA